MHSILKKTIWASLLLIPFVALYVASGHTLDVPNWGSAGMFFPFISGKNMLFRLLVEVAFFSWVALALSDPRYRLSLRKSPILIAYGIFMLVLLIADLLGVDPFKSFWSNFERMEGYVAHLHFFAYFIVLSAMLQTLAEYGRMFKTMIVSNIIVLIFGFGQLLGANGYIFSKLLPGVAAKFSAAFPVHMSENRLDATLGNSAYFAIYCLLFIFILALVWSQKAEPRKHYWYPVLMVLNLIALFYTGTRGTQIGLLVGGFITLSFIAWFEKGKTRKFIIGVLVAGAVLVGSLFAFKDSALVQSSPTLARFASISPTDLTGMSRLSIWKISYEAWKERPILGYGQENFQHIFASKFIPEKMWMLESWYDRSHDVFFDWLVAAGALGLLSYLSLYVVAFWLLWRRKSDMPFKERAIITGALVGYFVHNIFVFDNLVSYIFFFFLLAYIAFRTGARGGVVGGKAVSEDHMKLMYLPLLGILFAGSFYFMVYEPFRVNKLVVRAIDVNRLIQTDKLTVAEAIKTQQESFEKAIALNTLGSEEAREQFVQMTARMSQITIPNDIPAEDQQRTSQAINDLIVATRTEAETSYERYKNNVRMLSLYGAFFNAIGDGASAEKMLVRAHELAPHKQLVSFDLERAYLLQGKMEEAYAVAKETFASAPGYPDALKLYMVAAVYAKKYAEARSHVESLGQTVPFDNDILSALVNTNQKSLAVQLLQEFKRNNPGSAAEIDQIIKEVLAK